jgi:hypothetical protein
MLRITTLLLVFVSAGCSQVQAPAQMPPSGGAENSIVGSWEMIEFRMTRGSDTVRVFADPEPLALTIYTPDRFAYVWRGQANSGAGSYVLDGATIIQTFHYLSDERSIGSVYTFRLDLEGDIMRFSGPLKVVSSSGEDITEQAPQLVEMRRRAGRKQ